VTLSELVGESGKVLSDFLIKPTDFLRDSSYADTLPLRTALSRAVLFVQFLLVIVLSGFQSH
jgi:hypothetical protein